MTMPTSRRARPRRPLRRLRAWLRWYIVGVHTVSGRVFDVVAIGVVLAAVGMLMADSVPWVHDIYGPELEAFEVVVGVLFVLEYAIRTWVATNKLRWIFSFYGLIDLLALLPFVVSAFGLTYLRVLRVLRIFAILKVTRYTSASNILLRGIVESRTKIGVFLLAVVVIETVVAFTMHALEPQTFSSVPDAMWWVVVTVTTVGYGDVVPVTFFGKLVAAFTMVTSFGIIAVPTGIVASEVAAHADTKRTCPRCQRHRHFDDANYCCICAEPLPPVAGG